MDVDIDVDVEVSNEAYHPLQRGGGVNTRRRRAVMGFRICKREMNVSTIVH